MTRLTRFGRKLALPSTLQIRHELTVLMQADERAKTAKAVEVVAPTAVTDLGESATPV